MVERRKQRLRKIKKEGKGSLSPLENANKKYSGHFLLSNLLDTAIEKLEEDGRALEKETVLYTPSSKFFRTKE